MSPSNQKVWLSVLSLCAASVAAQDVPVVENPYALKKKKPAGPAAPVAPVDAALALGVGKRIEECYLEEQKAPMSDEDRKLLKKFSSELVHDLESSLRFSSCQIDKPATERCLKDLATMECATLAEPVVSAGWDRHLTPEARTQVRAYAKALAYREAGCNGLQGEEAAIVSEIRIDKLSILIEAQIVIGQCKIMPHKQAECDGQLKDTSCQELVELNSKGEVQKICTELYPCSDIPEPEAEPKSE